MKHIIYILFALIMLAGCANEAYYADHEYGMATVDAFDRQIVHKDYAYANTPVEGMDGIHAEPTMEMYHGSFGAGFTQESIDILSPGAN